MNRTLIAGLLALTGLATLRSAQASIVTLTGTDFNVVYNTSSLGLFGTPMLLGDYLVFTPNAFTAQSLNGAGTTTTDSEAAGIQLIAHPGFQFGNLSVVAIGDYLMQGVGSSVGVTGSLMATSAAQPLTQTTAPFILSGPLNVDNGVVQNWSGSATINDSTPTDTPGYNPWLSQAGTIDVALDNTLTATTVPGQLPNQAFIQEKFGSIELVIVPEPVPLPNPLWLMGSGLALIALLRGRLAV